MSPSTLRARELSITAELLLGRVRSTFNELLQQNNLQSLLELEVPDLDLLPRIK